MKENSNAVTILSTLIKQNRLERLQQCRCHSDAQHHLHSNLCGIIIKSFYVPIVRRGFQSKCVHFFGFIIMNMSIYVSQRITFIALMSGNRNDDVTHARSINLDALSNCVVERLSYSLEKI